jgi:hypothetical protein
MISTAPLKGFLLLGLDAEAGMVSVAVEVEEERK